MASALHVCGPPVGACSPPRPPALGLLALPARRRLDRSAPWPARRPSSSRCRRSGSTTTAPTPRCAGTRSPPQAYLTSPDRLFVRNHTATPTIDVASLPVAGLRRRPRPEPDRRPGAVSLSYDDLRALPVTRLTTVHECTGNGRSFFAAPAGADGGRARRGSSAPSVPSRGRACDCAPSSSGSGSTRLRSRSWPRVSTRSYVDAAGRLRTGPAAVPDQPRRWTTRCSSGAPTAATSCPTTGSPIRLVLPGWVGIGSIKWLRLAGGLHGRADLAVEHDLVPDDRRRLPGRQPAADGRTRCGRPSSWPGPPPWYADRS